MDGYQLRDRIEDLFPGLPVIAVTGHTDEDNMRRLEKSKFAYVAIKPVDRSRLSQIVSIIQSSTFEPGSAHS